MNPQDLLPAVGEVDALGFCRHGKEGWANCEICLKARIGEPGLAPCPHCPMTFGVKDADTETIWCPVCDASAPDAETWNRRSPPAPSQPPELTIDEVLEEIELREQAHNHHAGIDTGSIWQATALSSLRFWIESKRQGGPREASRPAPGASVDSICCAFLAVACLAGAVPAPADDGKVDTARRGVMVYGGSDGKQLKIPALVGLFFDAELGLQPGDPAPLVLEVAGDIATAVDRFAFEGAFRMALTPRFRGGVWELGGGFLVDSQVGGGEVTQLRPLLVASLGRHHIWRLDYAPRTGDRETLKGSFRSGRFGVFAARHDLEGAGREGFAVGIRIALAESAIQ